MPAKEHRNTGSFLVLVFTTVCATVCVWAAAESTDWNYDLNYAILRGYNGAGGDVTVPAEIDGYTVDVIEFIDFAHSPKNLMLRCVKDRRAGERNLSAAWELAEKYGFRQALLELAEKKRLSAQNTAF